jgi:putative membrane protein
MNMTKNPMLAVGLAAAMVLSVTAAQAQNNMGRPNAPAANSPATDTKATNANKADKDSQKFIKNAIEGNFAEVDLGTLAQQKGKNGAVKEYGAMLVKDHGAANEKAKAIAAQLGVTPPTGSSVMQKASYAKMKILSGDTFDRTFAKDMIKDHEADIKQYQKESAKTDAAGAFAKETLPTLQQHLKAAQALHQQVQLKQSMR